MLQRSVLSADDIILIDFNFDFVVVSSFDNCFIGCDCWTVGDFRFEQS